MRDAVEDDDDFARAGLQNGLERHGELFAGIADGEAAVHIEDVDSVVLANVDFDGSVESHGDRRGDESTTPQGIIR